MDCKVFVIVDFDNFFPRPIPEIPINKIEFLFKEIVRDIITNVHNVQNIIIRIYGGWYQDDTLTNRASQLLSISNLIVICIVYQHITYPYIKNSSTNSNLVDYAI